MLELRNVSAANRGITQLNFSVAAGEIVALIGRNGAGKTTLLRLALGLIHPTAGTVRRTVGNGDIGQLIDAPFCYPELTVTQNLRMHAWLYGIDPGRVTDSINRWELQPYRDRHGVDCPGRRQAHGNCVGNCSHCWADQGVN